MRYYIHALIILFVTGILSAQIIPAAPEKKSLSSYEQRYECMRSNCCNIYTPCSAACILPENAGEAELDKYSRCINSCTQKLIKCAQKQCSWSKDDSSQTFVGDDDPCGVSDN